MIDPLTSTPAAGVMGELGAAVAQNQAWLAELEERSRVSEPGNAPSSNALPPLGIDGAGFFVLHDGGTYVYARTGRFQVAADGRLLDEEGREVLGFADRTDPRAAPQSLRAQISDIAAGRFSRYEVDERGVFRGIIRKIDPRSTATVESSVELGRLCIATFPAPERLSPHDGGTAVATGSAGSPKFSPAGSPHVGELRRQPLQPSLETLRDNLRRLWSLSGRAEIDVAIAATNDALARIALNLVK